MVAVLRGLNFWSQQWLLSTYLIPGLVWKGVRLGSDRSSGSGFFVKSELRAQRIRGLEMVKTKRSTLF